MIAALFVETEGVYFGLPDVDPWDIERDEARALSEAQHQEIARLRLVADERATDLATEAQRDEARQRLLNAIEIVSAARIVLNSHYTAPQPPCGCPTCTTFTIPPPGGLLLHQGMCCTDREDNPVPCLEWDAAVHALEGRGYDLTRFAPALTEPDAKGGAPAPASTGGNVDG